VQAPVDPFTVAGSLQKEAIPASAPPALEPSKLVLPERKAANPKDPDAIDIPAPPKECAGYVGHKAKAKKGTCEAREETLALLNAALGETDGMKRDAALAQLEACAGVPAGMIRALRADLAPAQCADALVAPLLDGKSKPAPEVHQVLLGLGLGGRLRRTAMAEPKLAPPHDKQRVLEFIKGPMATWAAVQAKAVEHISRAGVDLSGYARGIVAVEAGMADMRMVEAFRAAPIPEEFAKDPELKDSYFAGLEQSMEPRKARGRDATLVGLRDLASVGVIADGRVDKARTLLSKMFGGRRIDALDALVLPPLPAASPSTLEQRLAARLPTFYAGLLLAPEVAKDAGIMRQLAERGVPVAQRRALQEATELPREVSLLALRARMAMGQRYWRAVDFDEATALAVQLRGEAGMNEESTFLLALSLALRGGPRDSVEMMAVAPALSLGIGNIAALDAISGAPEAGALGGLAALDAAMILQISPPDKPDAKFWSSLADRYRRAAGKLADPELKKRAEQRALSAEEVSKASPASP
jgi:hypothetical protein